MEINNLTLKLNKSITKLQKCEPVDVLAKNVINQKQQKHVSVVSLKMMAKENLNNINEEDLEVETENE